MSKIILLIGGSGSGKSTLGKALEDRFIPQLISYTTRPMREGEVSGEDYYFFEKSWLEKHIRKTDVAERTTYDGNEYGLFCMEIEEKLKQGDVYFVCNRDGAEQIIKIYKDCVIPFWLNVTESTMRERMSSRGDSLEGIENRIRHAIETKELEPPSFEHIELDANWETERQIHEIITTISYEEEK